ncbi:MAG: hypothetical protein HZB13_19985 [Acidobacteria bacterium]|nr:hypothetical protein [Acidobacteriota bacterium]
MPPERFLSSPRQVHPLLSRRSMLHAGLFPLLALRGETGAVIPSGVLRMAPALPLEGGEAGQHGLAISPDGSTAYVSFKSPDVVLAVDLRTGRLRSSIDLAPAGSRLSSSQAVLSADGKLLFVVNHGVENVAVIDTAAERVVNVFRFVSGWADPMKAGPGGKVHIGLLDGQLVTVSSADLSYRALSFKASFTNIALSPQRPNLLYAISSESYGMPQRTGERFFCAIDLDTGLELRRVRLPQELSRASGGITRLEVSASGDTAYLGSNFIEYGKNSGYITPFDLKNFQCGASTAIEDGVSDFAIHPETGRLFAMGELWGPMEGREDGRLFISEWDPSSQKITRRMPVFPCYATSAIVFDPLDPRFVYATDGPMSLMRKVDLQTGAEVMRVRFYPGKRYPSAAARSGSVAYITCSQSPLIHKLDLNSGRLSGSVDLPGLSGSLECGYFDGKLYVGGYNYFSVIDAADGSLIFDRRMPDGLFLGSLRFFRDKIAAAAGPVGGDLDRMLILDARTLDVLGTFRFELPLVGRRGCAVASPDGSKLYVQQGVYREKTILQVLDSETLRVRKRIEPPTTSEEGGDGEVGEFDEQRRIAYLGGNRSIYKVHMDTDELLGVMNISDVFKAMGRPNTQPESNFSGIHLSPAKDRLLIVSSSGHCVFQYDLRNEKWIPEIVRVGMNPGVTVVSPDRKYLYTVSGRSDTVARLDTTTGELLDVMPLGGPVSQLNIGSLSHGASLQSLPVVPGCLMVIRDWGGLPGEIGPPFLTSLQLDADGRVATELAETKVLFDGVPAPILSAYAAKVGVVVPYGVGGKNKVTVQLIYRGEETFPIEFNVADAYPGIFTVDSSGQGQVVMVNQDGTPNGPANPAARGSEVVFYATGCGQTDPPGVDGEYPKDVLARPVLPVYAWIQGQEAEVLFAGSAPGMVAGVTQIKVRVPLDIPFDVQTPVSVKVGGWPPSQDGVWMAVG